MDKDKKEDTLKILRLPNDSDYIPRHEPNAQIYLRLKVDENETKYKRGTFGWSTQYKYYEEPTGSILLTLRPTKYKRELWLKARYIEVSESKKISRFNDPSSIEGERTFIFEGDSPEVVDFYWISDSKEVNTSAPMVLTKAYTNEFFFCVVYIDGISDFEGEQLELKGEILFNGRHLSEYSKSASDYLVHSYNTYRNMRGDISTSFYFKLKFSDHIFETVKSDKIELTFILHDKFNFTPEAQQKTSIELLKDQKDRYEPQAILPTVQVAVVGDVNIVENNHKPCKYTSIEVFHKSDASDTKTTSDSVIIFDETKSIEVYSYPLVWGEDETSVFVKQNFLTLDKCELKGDQKHSVADKQILVHRNKNALSSSLFEEDIYVDTTNTTIEIPVHYDYLLTSKLFIPIHCIWPLAVKQSYDLSLSTCRHSKRVFIDVYPDIEWTMKLSVEKVKNEQDDASLFKKNKTDWNIYFSFGYEYNNSEKTEELSILLHSTSAKGIDNNDFAVKTSSEKIKEALIDYAKNRILKNILKVTDTAEFILNLFDFLKDLTKSTEDLTSSKSKAKIKLELRDKKYKFDINYPKFAIEMSWQAATTQVSPGILLKGKASGRLIGGTFTVDLLAVASGNGYVKIFVFAVDFIVNNYFKKTLKFDLVFEANLNFEAEGTYNSSSDETDFKVQLSGDIRVFVELSLTDTKKESTKIETKYNSPTDRYQYEEKSSTKTESSFTAKGEGGMIVTADVAPEDDGVYVKLNAYNKELFVKVYSERKIKKDRDGAMSKTRKPDQFQRADTPEKRQKEQDFLDSLPEKQTNQEVKNEEEDVYYKGVLLKEKTWQLFEDGNEYKVKLWDKTPENDVTYAKLDKDKNV